MSKYRRLFSFILSFGLLYSSALAQVSTERLESANFQNQPIKSILDQLADLYEVRIFYQDDIQLDRNFSFGYTDKSLDEVLDRLLSETTLGFIDYRGYGKVIAPKVLIAVDYSSDYYKALEGNQGSGQQRPRADIIGDITLLASDGQATLTGIVLDAQTGEPVIGAAVQVPALENGTATDVDGRYSLIVPAGTHQIEASFIGYANFYKEIDVRSSGEYDINLDKSAIELQEVTVSAQAADASVGNVQIGVASIDIQEIEKLPSFLGEADVVKTFLLQRIQSSNVKTKWPATFGKALTLPNGFLTQICCRKSGRKT